MATVTPQMIKELRDRTQAGMSDCKGALTEAEGDMEKAVEIILKKGQAKSAKRAGAVATEGEVRASVSPDKRAATVVEVNSQTDFVARNDQFQKFVGDVLALAEKTAQGADLGAASLDGKTVADAASDLTAKIGEKIAVRRWARVEVAAGKLGLAHSYTHLGGKIGVVLALETDSAATAAHAATAELADTIAMQIAAMNPGVLERGEVDAAEVAKQREIFEAQLAEDPKPKPKEAWPKIIEGKVNKWFSEVALLEQESVQTPGQTIDKLRQAAEKTAGGTITVKAFVRFERGEGLSKKQDDFAAEVAKMAGA